MYIIDKPVENTMKVKKLGENENYENELKLSACRKFNFDDDLRRLNYSSIGLIIPNRYCQCEWARSLYQQDNLKNFDRKFDHQLYELDQLTNDKRSLTLNQLLEFTDTKVAVTKTNTTDKNNAHRFDNVTISPANNNCHFETCSGRNNLAVVKVPERTNKNAPTLRCLPYSIFSDKRLVSLFRSVALYWFFCLNTLLTKGEFIKRKSSSAFDWDGGTTAALAAFDSNELRFRISPIALNSDFEDVTDDLFWRMLSEVLRGEENYIRKSNSALLTYAEHSREHHYFQMLRQVLLRFVDAALWPADAKEWAAAGSILAKRASSVDGAAPVRKKFKSDKRETGSPDSSDDRGVPCESVEADVPVASKPTEDAHEAETGERTEPDESAEDEKYVFFEKYWADLDKYLDEWKSEEKGSIQRDEASTQTEPDSETASSASFFDQNCYFLPEGIFNVDENDYPQYNLWCSPLIIEEMLAHNSPFKSASMQNDTSGDGGGGAAASASASAAASTTTFKPYRLWESSFAPEDDQIPDFYLGEELSVFSIPYYPRPDIEHRRQASEEASVYSLWGSPNIIDFLPGIGCLRFVNEDDYSTNSSPSSDSAVDVECATEEPFASLRSRRHDSYLVRGKFLNLKPVMNGFVSFTDRGAFKYYKKPPISLGKPKPQSGLAFVYEKSKSQIPLNLNSKPVVVVDDADKEVNQINKTTTETSATAAAAAATTTKNESSNTACYFKPIQPAFKVDTDVQPEMERSPSGTYYLQDRKFFTFKHELDSTPFDETIFKPKYEVSANEKACQTENFLYSPRRSFEVRYDNRMYLYHRASNHKKQQLQEATASTTATATSNPFQNAAFFYSLEEVFNYFGKSNFDGMGE